MIIEAKDTYEIFLRYENKDHVYVKTTDFEVARDMYHRLIKNGCYPRARKNGEDLLLKEADRLFKRVFVDPRLL